MLAVATSHQHHKLAYCWRVYPEQDLILLSRRSRQRERLHATGLSICSSVCLFVCLSVCRQNTKTRFSQKLSNLELLSLLTTIRSRTWAFQRTHYWTPKILDGGDPPSWKSTRRHFFSEGDPIWIKFRRLVQNDMSTTVMWSKSK